jgi:hypothetical protein
VAGKARRERNPAAMRLAAAQPRPTAGSLAPPAPARRGSKLECELSQSPRHDRQHDRSLCQIRTHPTGLDWELFSKNRLRRPRPPARDEKSELAQHPDSPNRPADSASLPQQPSFSTTSSSQAPAPVLAGVEQDVGAGVADLAGRAQHA